MKSGAGDLPDLDATGDDEQDADPDPDRTTDANRTSDPEPDLEPGPAAEQSEERSEQTEPADAGDATPEDTTETEEGPESNDPDQQGDDDRHDVVDDLPESDRGAPWVLLRDRVKDDRPENHQLLVTEATNDYAKAAEDELGERLEDDLSRLDVREAIYLAGMMNLDDAESILRDWGYDFEAE